jgi:hypothetical protein
VKPRKIAKLRCCMSCEWIFNHTKERDGVDCPKCQMPSYSAHYVYGDKCYRFQYSQIPWMNKKLDRYRVELQLEITNDRNSRVKGLLFSHQCAWRLNET